MALPVIVIAGSDSSGGAGLARDVATITALGGSARPVVTAVTAQTDGRVTAVEQMPASLVAAQLEAALETGPTGAVKIGMLGAAQAVEAVAAVLSAWPRLPVVLDPVLASSSGVELLDTAGRDAMKQELLPIVEILTPNLPEAALLAGLPAASTAAEIAAQAEALLACGPRAVLMKGGHAEGAEAVDRLFAADGSLRCFAAPRAPVSLRGTGCTLASALAAGLAAGQPPAAACEAAKAFVQQRIASAG
ncbi:hydroxymethylpyrimidine/phosphomethylpyrimidine kinase [Pelagibius sp.]|uniref:hydroxymethylpyrimidine/phosphomethylpyrimidine kinase n=1 Tax=Pelagibius sp. TaxID=1931238 RepID=UPI00260619EF|nr:hydroxymethylpyrimidine/phosphomethylpyrimidine kinase [Pelagibius sp.]